jgi:hypothetical protein
VRCLRFAPRATVTLKGGGDTLNFKGGKMKILLTDWQRKICFQAVKELKDRELKRFMKDEDMEDFLSQRAYWDISRAFDDLLEKLGRF